MPGGELLPAKPLQEVIRERIGRFGIEEVGRDLQVKQQRVRAFLRQDVVMLSTADEWAMALGTHLTLVYP